MQPQQNVSQKGYVPSKAEMQIRYGVAYVFVIVFIGVFINTVYKSTGLTLTYTFLMIIIHGIVVYFYARHRFKLWQEKNKPKEKPAEVVDVEIIK